MKEQFFSKIFSIFIKKRYLTHGGYSIIQPSKENNFFFLLKLSDSTNEMKTEKYLNKGGVNKLWLQQNN